MTRTISLDEAAAQLPLLIEQAQHGVEVVLTKDSMPVAKLVASGASRAKPHRQFGSAQGQVQMSDDFDEPLDEFAEYQ